MKHKQGIRQPYAQNPVTTDHWLPGPEANTTTRRGFLSKSSLIAMSVALGTTIPFAKFMPAGLIPIALAETDSALEQAGKDGLIVLNDRPINAETPAHLLDDKITPATRLFVRNNGIPPVIDQTAIHQWKVDIEGESCVSPKAYSIDELKTKFEAQTLQLQMECGGNGRSEYYPPAKGNQWTNGAIGCPEWTGIRLADVLADCGIKDDAVYVAYESADKHLSGDPTKLPISRGVPVHKAMESESMLVWAMNGEPLPALHGYPLRLICAGWPGSVSGKWLTKILVRNQLHDGPKMTGQSYRIPCKPVAPGTAVADDDMCIIESMPVKSIVTFPKSGISHNLGESLAIRGHAWAGDQSVSELHTSIDFGATWQTAILDKPVNRLAWQHWHSSIHFPEPGYYEIWARAVDQNGSSQPMVLPGWNPRGYLNNACHRIAVKVMV